MTRLLRPSTEAIMADHERRIRALERIAAPALATAESIANTDAGTSYVGAWARVPYTLASDQGDPFVYDQANGIWTPNYAMSYDWSLDGILTASSDLASPHRVVLYFSTGGDGDPSPGGGFMGTTSPCRLTGGIGPPNAWGISASGTVPVVPSETLNLWTAAADSTGGPTLVADYTLAVAISFTEVS